MKNTIPEANKYASRPKGNAVWTNEIYQAKSFARELAEQQGAIMNEKFKQHINKTKLNK